MIMGTTVDKEDLQHLKDLQSNVDQQLTSYQSA